MGGGPEFSKKSEFHKEWGQKGIKTLIRPSIFPKKKIKMFWNENRIKMKTEDYIKNKDNLSQKDFP